MYKAFRNPRISFGSTFLILLVLTAITAPYIAPYNPTSIYPADSLTAPNWAHLFGTDTLGRDVLSRVIHGSRYSLFLGLMAVVISGTLGTIFGLISGYVGGYADTLIMRVVDVGLAFPSVLLALLVIAIIGPGLTSIIIAIGVASTPPFIRLIRGSVLSIKEEPFVEAAQAIGANNARILSRHILPEVFAPAMTMATLRLAGAIFSASSLGFLGFGVQPPTPEWGVMVAAARHQMRSAWWVSTFSGLAIFISVISINILGDGLRDELDPKLRGQV